MRVCWRGATCWTQNERCGRERANFFASTTDFLRESTSLSRVSSPSVAELSASLSPNVSADVCRTKSMSDGQPLAGRRQGAVQRRDDLCVVADDTVVGGLEDRCLGILVDRHDQTGAP